VSLKIVCTSSQKEKKKADTHSGGLNSIYYGAYRCLIYYETRQSNRLIRFLLCPDYLMTQFLFLFIHLMNAGFFLFVVMDCESRRNSGSAYLLHVIFYTFFPISLDNGTCLCAHVFRIRSFYFYFLFFFLETHTMMDGQMLAVCE
jgi:hypothetical protein